MATSLEQRIVALEEKNKKIEHELDRVKAVNEIQNLMSKYEYWHTSGENDKKGKFIAQKTPGARVEYIVSGVFEGSKHMTDFLCDLHSGGKNKGKEKYDGGLAVHPLTTPIIEVAGDGKTARGLWISPGVEVHSNRNKKFNKPLQPLWILECYAADFVKEDGIWKWLRIHLYRVYQCPFDKPWTEIDCQDYFDNTLMVRQHFDTMMKPDRPTTVNQMYSPKVKSLMQQGLLPVPEPYEHYEEWMACVKKAE
jgi:hypothetical protein